MFDIFTKIPLYLCLLIILLVNGTGFAQNKTVAGIVTDEKGTPVADAFVTTFQKTNSYWVSTRTDSDGIFRFKNLEYAGTYVLMVSSLGYEPAKKTYTIHPGDVISFNITIKSGFTSELNDVVVVGYGKVKRKDLVGAVSSIGIRELQSRPVDNVLQAMQGKIAGVDITSNQRPGEIGEIRVRGARSISASNAPLFVLDGIPLLAGGIESLNPNDVQSIDVLKDASSTAIYGSRGANGVIMITTKKGKAGKTNISYYGKTTVETLENKKELMNSEQYIEYRRDAYRRITYLNPSASYGYPLDAPSLDADYAIFGKDPYSWANILKGWDGGTWDGAKVPTTDWASMVKRTGITHDHTISVSGGTDKIKAYSSFGYLNQKGTQLGQDYSRYSGLFNINITPVSWFHMGGSISATYRLQNYGFSTTNISGPVDLYNAALLMLPYSVPFDSNGKRINLPGADVNIVNPIGEDKYNINLRKILRTFGSFYASVSPFKGLKYRVNFGPDINNFYNGRWMDAKSINRGGGESGSTNYARLLQTTNLAYTLDNLLYYEKSLGDHNFEFTGLQSATYSKLELSSMTASNLPWDNQKWYQLGSASKLDDWGSDVLETALSSYLIKGSYSYQNKIMLTASARWDGSAVFAEGNRWDFFPSIGLGWRLEKEKFLENVTWLEQLKLRGGIGSTGNASVVPYTTNATLETVFYTWGSAIQPGFIPSNATLSEPNPLPNRLLGWEKTVQGNLGFDFSILENRINGSIDVFAAHTYKLLLKQKVPSVLGYQYTYSNVGATNSNGLEITLNTKNITNKHFDWSSTITFTTNHTKIAELSNGKVDDISNLWFIGQQPTVFYDYEKIGIWQNTEDDIAEIAKFNANGNNFKPGDIKVNDLNNDYKIDPNNDRKIVGHMNPNFTVGLVNTFTYKNFDLQIFLYSRLGYTIKLSPELLQARYAARNVTYWTPENNSNDYPAPNKDAEDIYLSTMSYYDGSFIKIRNISLGYHIPDHYGKKIGLSNMKVYAQAINPIMLYSAIDWIDPDVGSNIYNRGFVLGVNVGL